MKIFCWNLKKSELADGDRLCRLLLSQCQDLTDQMEDVQLAGTNREERGSDMATKLKGGKAKFSQKSVNCDEYKQVQ